MGATMAAASTTSGTVTITGSTISGNSAVDGGGIYNVRGLLAIAGGTLSDNSAVDEAAGSSTMAAAWRSPASRSSTRITAE